MDQNVFYTFMIIALLDYIFTAWWTNHSFTLIVSFLWRVSTLFQSLSNDTVNYITRTVTLLKYQKQFWHKWSINCCSVVRTSNPRLPDLVCRPYFCYFKYAGVCVLNSAIVVIYWLWHFIIQNTLCEKKQLSVKLRIGWQNHWQVMDNLF